MSNRPNRPWYVKSSSGWKYKREGTQFSLSSGSNTRNINFYNIKMNIWLTLVSTLIGKPGMTSGHHRDMFRVRPLSAGPLLHPASSTGVLRGQLHHLPGVPGRVAPLSLPQGVRGLSHHNRPERWNILRILSTLHWLHCRLQTGYILHLTFF